MTDADRLRLVEQLQRNEDAAHRHGSRFMPYVDTVGKVTIGWGRNLTDRGISEDEADFLLGNDMNEAENDLRRTFPWFSELDSVRQAALVNIAFNLGLTRLLTFERALTAMAAGNYAKAADDFMASRWSEQVGARAVELTEQIRTGRWAA